MEIRVTMGTSPAVKGTPRSCMGMAASSDIKIVITKSDGSSSPICRFPISRMAQMTAT